MVRTYVRKKQMPDTPEETIRTAVKDLLSKSMSLRQAAARLQIQLQKKFEKVAIKNKKKSKYRSKTKFTISSSDSDIDVTSNHDEFDKLKGNFTKFILFEGISNILLLFQMMTKYSWIILFS